MYGLILVSAVLNERQEASFQGKVFTPILGQCMAPRTATTEVSQHSLCVIGVFEALSGQIVGLGSL